MLVTCPKCEAEIEVMVSSLHPNFRWGSNNLSEAARICVDLQAGAATLPLPGVLNCPTLDLAVEKAAIGTRA